MTPSPTANSAKPILYGASYSVYVRIIQLTLMEKGIEFDMQEVDVFDDKGISTDYLQLNPFGKIPTFSHDGFTVYETSAITRYIDMAFENTPKLYPTELKNFTKVNQIIAILDSYAYKNLVWDIYVEACESDVPDHEKIELATDIAKTCLQALATINAGDAYITGSTLTIADLHAAPIFDYFMKSPQGQQMLPTFPAIAKWWESIQNRTNCKKLFADS